MTDFVFSYSTYCFISNKALFIVSGSALPHIFMSASRFPESILESYQLERLYIILSN